MTALPPASMTFAPFRSKEGGGLRVADRDDAVVLDDQRSVEEHIVIVVHGHDHTALDDDPVARGGYVL